MQSFFLRLNGNDIIKGVVVAVLVAVLGSIEQGLTSYGLDLMSYDWNAILDLALTAGVGYLAKNLLSDKDGKFLGRV